MSKLQPKQLKFAQQYLLCWNATQAARAAGYSKKTANEQGCRLLANVSIREFIKEQVDKNKIQFNISQEKIVNELAKIAFFDPKNVVDEYKSGASMKPWVAIDENVSGGISSVNETSSGTTFQTHNKVKALELLGKHVGMWRDTDAGHGNDKESRKVILDRVHELFRKRRDRGSSTGDNQG